MKRHKWNDLNVCTNENCGIRREGYQGGRTGWLSYFSARGEYLGTRAPSCENVQLTTRALDGDDAAWAEVANRLSGGSQ